MHDISMPDQVPLYTLRDEQGLTYTFDPSQPSMSPDSGNDALEELLHIKWSNQEGSWTPTKNSNANVAPICSRQLLDTPFVSGYLGG